MPEAMKDVVADLTQKKKKKALSCKTPDSGKVFAKLPAIVKFFSLARGKGLLLLAKD